MSQTGNPGLKRGSSTNTNYGLKNKLPEAKRRLRSIKTMENKRKACRMVACLSK